MPDDPTPPNPPGDPPDPQDPPDPPDDDPLEAIRADPAATHKAMEALRGEAMEYRRRLRKVEAELERTKTESLTGQERAIAEAEQRGREAARTEAARSLLEAQVVAAAAGKLQDPADAARYLDLEALLELDERERPAELEKAIGALLESKAYLAVATGNGPAPSGVRSPGPRTAPGGTKETDQDGSAWLRKAARRR